MHKFRSGVFLEEAQIGKRKKAEGAMELPVRSGNCMVALGCDLEANERARFAWIQVQAWGTKKVRSNSKPSG
jgi:hypothetical protein